MARRVDGMHVWASLCGLDLAGIDSDRSEKKFSLLMSFTKFLKELNFEETQLSRFYGQEIRGSAYNIIETAKD